MKQKVKAGDRVVGIIGLGVLGVMGVKIAKAMGCVVTVNSRTNSKEAIAKKSGADDMASNAGKFDILLNTVPAYHEYAAYLPLLDRQSRIGKLVLLGVHEGLIVFGFVCNAVAGYSRFIGSGIGSIRATQEVNNLCAEREHHLPRNGGRRLLRQD